MTSILGPLWESLTRPAVTIYDEGKRRQAKQLAGLLILILAIGTLIQTVTIFFVPPEQIISTIQGGLLTLFLVALAYWPSRTSYYRFSAYLTIVFLNGIALLNSGYSEQETPRQIEGSHASGYLQRPFNINSLLTKVNQVLSV